MHFISGSTFIVNHFTLICLIKLSFHVRQLEKHILGLQHTNLRQCSEYIVKTSQNKTTKICVSLSN